MQAKVSQKAHDRLDEIHNDFMARSQRFGGVEQDPISNLIAKVSESSIRSFLSTLTGFTTRNSYSVNSNSGVNQAANFSQGQMAKFGFDSQIDTFRSGACVRLLERADRFLLS